jgi:allantoinase
MCGSMHVLALWVLVFGLYLHSAYQEAPHTLPLQGGGQGSSRSDRSSSSSSSSRQCKHSAPAVYYSHRVVFEDGMQAGYIHIVDGIIQALHHGNMHSAADFATNARVELIDFGHFALSPGLIDAHVHVSAVGGRRWEGYNSASLAAVAGGTTTLITMPLNSLPPTTTVAALNMEVEEALSAEGNLFTDIGFWGGGVPSNINNNELSELASDKRILGIKSFLAPLPPAAGYEAVTPTELLAVAKFAAREDIPLLVHCELMSVEEIDALHQEAVLRDQPRSYQNYLATRPAVFEERAISELINVLDSVPDLRAHIVHLSDAGSLSAIAAARARLGGRLTAETCPHYLAFAAEAVPDGETRLKCMPPIRAGENREQLWAGLRSGTLGLVSSDHSPCLPEMRKLSSGSFLQAWGGIAGLQFNLAATWNEAYKRGFSPSDMSRWWSEGPAKLSGLWDRKGSIAVGKVADLVVWDMDVETISDNSYHRHAGSPYVGMRLRGQVRHTFVAGREVFRYDEASGAQHFHANSCGRILERTS